MPFTRSFSARFDSGTANNPALNLTGANAVTVSFVAETNTGGAGDLIMDRPGGGIDPDTQVEINGVSYDFTFELSGTLPVLAKNGAQQVPDQYEGSTVYIVTVHDYPTAGQTSRLTFMPDETATLPQMNAFGNGAISIQNVQTTPTGEAVCFAAGTMILTPSGEVAIEDLAEGDMVMTADNGPQKIRWIACTHHRWTSLPHKAKPILIPAAALGGGLPRADLLVSPQHRILLDDIRLAERFGDRGVLVPACALTDLPGIRQMAGKRQITYYHILLPHHAIVWADGAASESFFPGPQAVKALGAAARSALLRALADLAALSGRGYGPTARPVVQGRSALKKLFNPEARKPATPLAA